MSATLYSKLRMQIGDVALQALLDGKAAVVPQKQLNLPLAAVSYGDHLFHIDNARLDKAHILKHRDQLEKEAEGNRWGKR